MNELTYGDQRESFTLRLHPNKGKAAAMRHLYARGCRTATVEPSNIRSWDFWIRFSDGLRIPTTAPESLHVALRTGGMLESTAEIVLDQDQWLTARVTVRLNVTAKAANNSGEAIARYAHANDNIASTF